MLSLIAYSEGTATMGDRGYNVLFGGKTFDDYSKHPNIPRKFIAKTGETLSSSASGRYQILKPTWDNMAKRLGVTDFSPENQDLVAAALMLERGAETDVLSGNYTGAVQKLNSVWTSLPGSKTGAKYHALRSPEFIAGAINKIRADRGAEPVAFTWNNQQYTNTRVPASASTQVQFPTFQSAVADGAFPIMGANNWSGYANMPIQRTGIVNPAGPLPFAISAKTSLSEGGAEDLVSRLFGLNPNVTYGMVDAGGLRPTTTITDPNTGMSRTLMNLPDGKSIDLSTGELMAADGTPFVQEAVPVPNDPGEDMTTVGGTATSNAPLGTDVPPTVVLPELPELPGSLESGFAYISKEVGSNYTNPQDALNVLTSGNDAAMNLLRPAFERLNVNQ